MIAALLAAAISLVALRLKVLSLSGCCAAWIVGTVIMGLGGLSWALPLLVFFISSSLLSWYRSRVRGNFEEAKGSRRDAAQVLANGGIAAALVLIQFISSVDLFVCYLGAIAAATADTWSTEIGLLWGKKPRSITSFKPVAPGSSGGVTLAGFSGALAGALTIALVGYRFQFEAGNVNDLLIVLGCGFGGSVFDSLLGATLQYRLRCTVCGKLTESLQHCRAPSEPCGGWRWLNNDAVNLLATACGAASAAALMLL